MRREERPELPVVLLRRRLEHVRGPGGPLAEAQQGSFPELLGFLASSALGFLCGAVGQYWGGGWK